MSNIIIVGPKKLSADEWYELAHAYFSAFFGPEAATQMLAHMPGAPLPDQSPDPSHD